MAMSACRLKADSEKGSEPLRNVCSAFALRRYPAFLRLDIGGEGGIRTHGADNRTTAFEF
jgi:hypothetical protein